MPLTSAGTTLTFLLWNRHYRVFWKMWESEPCQFLGDWHTLLNTPLLSGSKCTPGDEGCLGHFLFLSSERRVRMIFCKAYPIKHLLLTGTHTIGCHGTHHLQQGTSVIYGKAHHLHSWRGQPAVPSFQHHDRRIVSIFQNPDFAPRLYLFHTWTIWHWIIKKPRKKRVTLE